MWDAGGVFTEPKQKNLTPETKLCCRSRFNWSCTQTESEQSKSLRGHFSPESRVTPGYALIFTHTHSHTHTHTHTHTLYLTHWHYSRWEQWLSENRCYTAAAKNRNALMDFTHKTPSRHLILFFNLFLWRTRFCQSAETRKHKLSTALEAVREDDRKTLDQ